jgi:hypothetical protein
MKISELLVEYKKDRKAPKFSIKPRKGHAPTQTGAGAHKDKKKAQKQGDTKHKKADIEEGLRDAKDNPCWKGYHPVGTKKKGGKTVPNCVPEAANPAQQAAIAINMKKHHKKPKSESLEEGTGWGTMGPKAAQQMLAAFNDASHGVEHFSNDEAAVQRIYDALKDVAREQQVVPHLKSLLNSAQHYAHQEFDTNPGSFKNWWQFVGQFLESLVNNYKEKGEIEDEPDFELDTNEAVKFPFAGAKVGQKAGVAGQWRNKGPKKNQPAKQGDLVGGV